jgi:hypothetical protein
VAASGRATLGLDGRAAPCLHLRAQPAALGLTGVLPLPYDTLREDTLRGVDRGAHRTRIGGQESYVRKIVLISLAVILLTLVPRAAWTGPVFPPPIVVSEGGSVTVPAAAVLRADTSAPDVAQALAGTDEVTVRGIKPGAAVLTLVTSGSIEARRIQVVPAGTGEGAAAFSGCPGLNLAGGATGSYASLTAHDLHAEWTPSSWSMLWTHPDGRIWASSALVTPLQQLGLPITPGVQLDWENHWELQASDAYGLIGYRLPTGAGSLMLGTSTLGPAGELEALVGPMSFSAVALLTPAGQMLSGAQTTLNVGPVTVGYETGPAGGSPTVAFHSGSVTVSAAAMPQGSQVGVGMSLADGVAITGSWMAQGGWSAGITLPLGPAAPAAGSGSSALGGLTAACGGPQNMEPANPALQ